MIFYVSALIVITSLLYGSLAFIDKLDKKYAKYYGLFVMIVFLVAGVLMVLASPLY